MRRREFIALLGSAASWPLAVEAQQPRRIGVLLNTSETDPESGARIAAFEEGIGNLGWIVGRNIKIDYRWYMGDPERARVATKELLRFNPDVLVANAGIAARAMQEATRTVPVVFTAVQEPVERGVVQSLARPGGNITGFTFLEPTVGAKLLELLKETAPQISHVLIMINPPSASIALVRSAESAAPKFSVEALMAPVHEPADIEELMTKLANRPGGGLVVPGDPFSVTHRKLVIEEAASHGIPAIYGFRFFATDGGLMSYGVNIVGQFRQAAGYVNRILRGEKPADLPVQQPTKFELVINLKTAKALGLTVPANLLATADEVIE